MEYHGVREFMEYHGVRGILGCHGQWWARRVQRVSFLQTMNDQKAPPSKNAPSKNAPSKKMDPSKEIVPEEKGIPVEHTTPSSWLFHMHMLQRMESFMDVVSVEHLSVVEARSIVAAIMAMSFSTLTEPLWVLLKYEKGKEDEWGVMLTQQGHAFWKNLLVPDNLQYILPSTFHLPQSMRVFHFVVSEWSREPCPWEVFYGALERFSFSISWGWLYEYVVKHVRTMDRSEAIRFSEEWKCEGLTLKLDDWLDFPSLMAAQMMRWYWSELWTPERICRIKQMSEWLGLWQEVSAIVESYAVPIQCWRPGFHVSFGGKNGKLCDENVLDVLKWKDKEKRWILVIQAYEKQL
jgi:hypothetical protein